MSQLLKLNQKQQEFINNNEDIVLKMAELMWDCNQEIDYDTMHPSFKYFDDTIKDNYISAACYLLLANQRML